MSAELTGKLETERKFDVDLDFALPDLRDLGGSAQTPAAPPEVERLIARYHDTDDLRLAAAGVTLRRRTGSRFRRRPDATRFARPCWPGAKSRSSWFPARPRSWRRLASGCASQVRRHPGQRTS